MNSRELREEEPATKRNILWSVFAVFSDPLKGEGNGIFIGASDVKNGERKIRNNGD